MTLKHLNVEKMLESEESINANLAFLTGYFSGLFVKMEMSHPGFYMENNIDMDIINKGINFMAALCNADKYTEGDTI